MQKVVDILSEYNKEISTIKAYKTRIRNVLNGEKKLASLGHFPKFFLESTINKYGFMKGWEL